MPETILVIEDDLEMARVLREGLQQESYGVCLASDGSKGLEMAATGTFAVIILDIMLPAIDGYTLARQLRASGVGTPILMLTALDATSDIVIGLDAGAEDYLTKPFSFVELLARLRVLTRRGRPKPAVLRSADLLMDTKACAITRDDQPISLTKTEYLLLKTLLQSAGHVVSREEIVKAVWGSRTAIEQNSIDVFVKTLRAKVDQDFSEKLIHTVRGFGYRLGPIEPR